MAIITLPDNFFEKEKPEGLNHDLYYTNEALVDWQKIEGLMEAELTETIDPIAASLAYLEGPHCDFSKLNDCSSFSITTFLDNILDKIMLTKPRLTRKRFKKYLMSLGYSRNLSEQLCRSCVGNGPGQYKSYKEAYVLSGLIWMNGGIYK